MSATSPAVPARFDPTTRQRRAMLAKINIARHQLAMEEDDYRQGLLSSTGQISLKQCNDAQLGRMLEWLKGKGFRALPGRRAAVHPMARKARALWISLHHLGVVHNASEQALEAFAKRQLGCERLVWARQSDAFRLIEALKQMGTRAGWQMHVPATQRPLSLIELQASLCDAILGKLKEGGIIPQDWGLHDAAWKLCGIENARAAPWTVDDYQRLAAGLGTHLRDAGGVRG